MSNYLSLIRNKVVDNDEVGSALSGKRRAAAFVSGGSSGHNMAAGKCTCDRKEGD